MARKPKGHWQVWENVERELLPVCRELGRFPTRPELLARGLGPLAKAIYHFGGVRDVAARLGYQTTGQIDEQTRRGGNDREGSDGHSD